MGNVLPHDSKTVLVTVGSTKFDDLVRAVDHIDFQRELQALGYTHILYQVGMGTYIPKTSLITIIVKRYLENFCACLNRADLVITHMGSGTLLEVFKHEKHAVIVPNPRVRGRHQEELLSVVDRSLVAELRTLKHRIRNPARGTGNFFSRLLPRREFNDLIYDLVNFEPRSGRVSPPPIVN